MLIATENQQAARVLRGTLVAPGTSRRHLDVVRRTDTLSGGSIAPVVAAPRCGVVAGAAAAPGGRSL